MIDTKLKYALVVLFHFLYKEVTIFFTSIEVTSVFSVIIEVDLNSVTMFNTL